jgi:hypothetical protein
VPRKEYHSSRSTLLFAVPLLILLPQGKRSSSNSELEELRGLGLAKSLKNQFADTVAANEKQNEAHLAQLRDLEERKAKTSEFRVSRNAPLSVADEKALSDTKWKKEDRANEQEALGYYRNYKADYVAEEEKAWKTTGKVHTSVGNEVSTREWEAAEGGQEKVTTSSRTATETATKSSDGVKQGCSCIIL